MTDHHQSSSSSLAQPHAQALPVAIATPLAPTTGSGTGNRSNSNSRRSSPTFNHHAELVAATRAASLPPTETKRTQPQTAIATPVMPPSPPLQSQQHSHGPVTLPSRLAVDDVVDAMDHHNDWYLARIVDVPKPPNADKYHVQFEGKPPKYNEWITIARMAPPGTRSSLVNMDDNSDDNDRSLPSSSTSTGKGGEKKSVPAHQLVHINHDQFAKIRSIISTELWKEIGGDLFGRWDAHTGVPTVEYVLGPGPRAKGGSVSFFQDEQYLETWGNALGAVGLEHIGEWHSHWQLELPHPSGGDCSTVIGAMQVSN
jgi:hypothetical protein